MKQVKQSYVHGMLLFEIIEMCYLLCWLGVMKQATVSHDVCLDLPSSVL